MPVGDAGDGVDSTIAGSVVMPPQLPECTPPGRRSIFRSKCTLPRVPVLSVGTAELDRGPSLASSTSAASASLCAATISLRPLEPLSSPVSMISLRLKPSLPAPLRQHGFQRSSG